MMSEAVVAAGRFDDIVATVLLDIAVIIVVARVVGWLFRKIRQPSVVGEIVAGILMGPTLLGAFSYGGVSSRPGSFRPTSARSSGSSPTSG